MRRFAAVLAAAACLLSACRAAVTARVAADGYTDEEILAYFDELAFSSEYGGYRGMVCKWTEEIVYRVEGDVAAGELIVLSDLAARLNEIPGFPGIRMTDGTDEANFTVSFVMQGELAARFGENARSASGMSRFTYRTSSGEIVRAEAGVASNITPQAAKASVICEEFLQSLGLAADSYTYPESVFYEGYNDSIRPAAIDWAVLELLYSETIRPGMAREDALAAARALLAGKDEATEEAA